jgi:hypothetical protein
LQCGFVRSNFCLAMMLSVASQCSGGGRGPSISRPGTQLNRHDLTLFQHLERVAA